MSERPLPPPTDPWPEGPTPTDPPPAGSVPPPATPPPAGAAQDKPHPAGAPPPDGPSSPSTPPPSTPPGPSGPSPDAAPSPPASSAPPAQQPLPPPPWRSDAPTVPMPSAGQTADATGPVIAQIGELSVTSTVVRTPAGDIPLRGSTWQITDHWLTEQKTPTWAIVMAIAGFCVLTVFSLLFLLVKETTYRGTAQITVTNGARQYVARVPVTTQAQVQTLYQQVNYVRSLAAL